MNENLHTDDCTDCGCDETCTAPTEPCEICAIWEASE